MSHPRTLPWPCTRIERDVLHELWQEGQRTGTPITVIVAEAVTAYLNQRLESTAHAAEPVALYRSEPRPAA